MKNIGPVHLHFFQDFSILHDAFSLAWHLCKLIFSQVSILLIHHIPCRRNFGIVDLNPKPTGKLKIPSPCVFSLWMAGEQTPARKGAILQGTNLADRLLVMSRGLIIPNADPRKTDNRLGKKILNNSIHWFTLFWKPPRSQVSNPGLVLHFFPPLLKRPFVLKYNYN